MSKTAAQIRREASDAQILAAVHPRTSALIEHIRQRDGQVGIGLGNAPEEWVTLARELEDELAAMKSLISLAVDCGEACGMDGAYPDAWEQMKAAAAK